MRILTATLAFSLLAPPLAAQEAGLTLAQVERKYRKMNEVHILKCDRDGNRIFTRSEMLCVQSIYQTFYLDSR
ncbi:MAG TPA: hypothetical protein VM891_00730 [Amaricoccus sp.]|jgi:hypothetical protein|nr:hypothetical protein [Amaricoccus sp.]